MEDWLKDELEDIEKAKARWLEDCEAEKENHFNFDVKEKIVKAGGSKVFNIWHSYGVSEDDFLSGLKWLCEDPLTEKGQLTRELGCTSKGELVKLRRVFGKDGFVGFYEEETGLIWRYNVSLNARDRV